MAQSQEARQVVQPYIDKGYRGIPEDALLYGSINEVADQINKLADQGYTDVIVRNLSSAQNQCMDCIQRLAEVKAVLKN